jgi:ribonuclease BN (tRNA processing enzyme)
MRRFYEAGFDISKLTAIFITHLHLDHVADLFNFFWYNMFQLARKKVQVHIYGPPSPGSLAAMPPGPPVPIMDPANPVSGTKDMLAGVIHAYRDQLNFMNIDLGPMAINYPELFAVTDISLPQVGASPANAAPLMSPFPVYEDSALRVTAILVPHGIFPAFAYRFESEDGSVTFSGDTGPSDNVSRIAHQSDILVHEVSNPESYTSYGARLVEIMRTHHTPATALGPIVTAAQPRALVLNHLCPANPDQMSNDAWTAAIKPTYPGPITVGTDLTQFGVGNRR